MQINNIFPKRDKTISIVKAIGIILMVVGHSGCPKWLHDYIYMFHMPLFFFCSGYFFKPVAQLSQLKDFIIKRIKKLYFPFVKWSLFFLLLHNILFKMNIYNDKYGFSGNVSSVYGVEDFMSRFLNIVFAMRGNEQLLGGFWFIRVLFISSIVLSVICCFKIKFNIKYNLAPSVLIVLVVAKYLGVSIPIIGDLALIFYGLIFVLMGYIYKRIENKNIYSIGYFVLFTICVLMGSKINYSNMLSYDYTNIVSYLFFATLGIVSVFCISFVLMKTKLSRLLLYIGDNTMVILALHFITFKIGNLLKIQMYGLPITQLACFPIIQDDNQLFWILYSILGIFIPLIIYKLYSDVKTSMLIK